ncbi:hypothetical protein ABZY58_11430 [Micromonospora tulbaghiae]|uniref:hypothetical protein n=1 Tax=Micromonospora tulbaghiae TaxID=479978 RepID=UPI0033B6B143
MELILGAMVMAWLAMKTVPTAVSDFVTTMRASKAGEWGLIDKERDRRAARAQARRDAWADLRRKRNQQAGGTGDYRPGIGAVLGDIYHGKCEDWLESRAAVRAARPPVGPDGRRPLAERVHANVEGRVARRRDESGMLGRVGRLLIEPVGGPVTAPDAAARPAPQPVSPPPTASGPRTACPTCGDTLTEHGGLWLHPAESTCVTARRPDGGYPVPQRVAEAATDLYRLNRTEGRTGASGETQTARDLHGLLGDDYPQHVYEQAAADAQHVPDPNEGMQPIGSPSWGDGTAQCARCDAYPPQPGSDLCQPCEAAMSALRNATDELWTQVDPDRSRGPEAGQEVVAALQQRNRFAWTLAEMKQATKYGRREAQHTAGCAPPTLSETQRMRNELYGKCAYRDGAGAWCENPFDGTDPYCHEHRTNAAPTGAGDNSTIDNGGTTVSTATGDVHDVETCKSECEALADDLGRVDTALDVVDEAIRSAAAAVERIEAWLQSKNADACVAGMAAALDALSADNIKELIDKVAAAKQGVQDTIDNLAPLEEAAELVGSTDGSALNGR